MSTESWKGTRPSTRMGALAMLRAKLHDVQQKDKRRRKAKGAKKDEIAVTAEEEILLDILSRRRRLRVHVHKADDIAALLRAADEFDLDIQVEHACDVYDTGIFRELADRGIPVTYGPVDSFAYKVELKHETWRNIGCLIESGADFGLMTDHPVSPCRQLFLQTRWFTRFGLSKQDAVEIVSFRNAKILGIDNILGSLAKRKWASFTCWNGDPFDITAYPETVYGEGRQLVSEGREQKQGR